MALEFRPNFNVNDIEKAVQERLDRIENAIIETLGFIGESFVRDARENANFTDRTGNLRSSIGFVILKNGQVIDQNFEEAGVGPDRQTGKLKSIDVAYKKAADFPKGFVLIVVAGMEYAAAVESKNFDVITGSSLIAEDALRKAVKSLGDKIPQMK